MNDVRKILDFWFSERVEEHWWKKDDAFDAELRASFGPVYERAAAGELSSWQDTPDGSQALVLVLDQFPRNMYRGTPKAFATDAQALAVADWAVDKGFDLKVPVERRVFLYMPFEHSEDIDQQNRCIDLVRQRCNSENYVKYATAHRDIIARFGRFPHRNAILGRPNTPEEEEYLSDPEAGF